MPVCEPERTITCLLLSYCIIWLKFWIRALVIEKQAEGHLKDDVHSIAWHASLSIGNKKTSKHKVFSLQNEIAPRKWRCILQPVVRQACWNIKATLVSTVGPAVPVNRCTGAWDVHFQKQTVWLFFCRTLTAEVSWADLLQWWIIQFYCSSSRQEKREFGKRGRERQINFLWSQFCSECDIVWAPL